MFATKTTRLGTVVFNAELAVKEMNNRMGMGNMMPNSTFNNVYFEKGVTAGNMTIQPNDICFYSKSAMVANHSQAVRVASSLNGYILPGKRVTGKEKMQKLDDDVDVAGVAVHETPYMTPDNINNSTNQPVIQKAGTIDITNTGQHLIRFGDLVMVRLPREGEQGNPGVPGTNVNTARDGVSPDKVSFIVEPFKGLTVLQGMDDILLSPEKNNGDGPFSKFLLYVIANAGATVDDRKAFIRGIMDGTNMHRDIVDFYDGYLKATSRIIGQAISNAGPHEQLTIHMKQPAI